MTEPTQEEVDAALKKLTWHWGVKEGMLARKVPTEMGLMYQWADPRELWRAGIKLENHGD